MAVPKTQSQTVAFTAHTHLILQFLPSGVCLSLPMDQPTVLGRPDDTQPESPYQLADLTPYNALQHGVSRRHCLLRLRDERLIISDMGSTNGTYLNGEQLAALTEYALADGDKLILGTLHLTLFFTSDDSAHP